MLQQQYRINESIRLQGPHMSSKQGRRADLDPAYEPGPAPPLPVWPVAATASGVRPTATLMAAFSAGLENKKPSVQHRGHAQELRRWNRAS